MPAPVIYSRPAYRPHYSPIVSLGLFPPYVGDALGADSRSRYLNAYQSALAAPIGETMTWNSGAASGAMTPTRDGWAGQRYCREFRQVVSIAGRTDGAVGTVCQTPAGDWQLVQN